MRNKIKQLLKKEGGFTLVELLGVIVILGLIVGISIPLIGNVIANAEEDTDQTLKKSWLSMLRKCTELQEGDIPEAGVTTDDLITCRFP